MNRIELNRYQNAKSVVPSFRGIRPWNSDTVGVRRNETRDITVRSEARALARTYVIHTREKASGPKVIVGTFSIFDVIVYVLIDLSLTL